MAVIRKLVDATLVIDNNVIGYVPNSLGYTEGLGEQKVRVQTSGGGNVQTVVSEDVSKKVAMIKFNLEPTQTNIDLLRSIKTDLNGHVVTISALGFTKTITGAVITKDYEVKFGMDEVINVEMEGNPAK